MLINCFVKSYNIQYVQNVQTLLFQYIRIKQHGSGTYKTHTQIYIYTLGNKRLLHPVMRYCFVYHSYSIFLCGLETSQLTVYMSFLCIVCTNLLYVCHELVIIFIDTREIGCISIPKCQWMVIVANLVKLFLHDAACWCGFVYAGSVSGIPASSCDNRGWASWHACYKALHAFYMYFCPFIQQGLAELTKILGGLFILVIALHCIIHPKYVLWGYSLAILQAAPPRWRYPPEGNQGLPDLGGVWRYCLGNGSYPRNSVCQMTLRCFAKCPCRTHRWSICRGAQEAKWHHCEKLPRRVPNHYRLEPDNLCWKRSPGKQHTLSLPSTG